MSDPDHPLRADRDTRVVAIDGEQVEIAYDPDGEVWHVRASSVPGLATEGANLDELLRALPLAIRAARLP